MKAAPAASASGLPWQAIRDQFWALARREPKVLSDQQVRDLDGLFASEQGGQLVAPFTHGLLGNRATPALLALLDLRPRDCAQMPGPSMKRGARLLE